MAISVEALSDKESADWLAELERAYPSSYYFTIVGDDEGQAYITQINPNEWDNGRRGDEPYSKLSKADLLAVIIDKPYYEKVMAEILSGKSE